MKLSVLSSFALALLLLSDISPAQETVVTTIKLYPSPKQILAQLEKSNLVKPVAPPVQSDNSSDLPGTLPPPLLKECGFRAFWQQDVGPTKNPARIQIYEMGDTSGAFSLFTLQNHSALKPASLGDDSFLDGADLWMWQSNLLVHLTSSSPSDKMRSRILGLGKEISKLIHQHAETPNLAKQLPLQDQVAGSLQYTLGPDGFQDLGLALNAWKLGLEMGAEASTAQYRFGDKDARVLLISYPTPQMARKFYAGIENSNDLLQNPSPDVHVFTKRSGPLIAILYGSADPSQAETILQAIRYSANLTWDEAPPDEQVRSYLLTIFRSIVLTGALLLITLGAGIALGLVRLGMKYWVPAYFVKHFEDFEILQLRLSDTETLSHQKRVTRNHDNP